jgi:hypothetical protein
VPELDDVTGRTVTGRAMVAIPVPEYERFVHMSAAEKKRCLEDFAEAVLRAIEAEDRQPDLWEQKSLAYGLSCIRAGYFDIARNQIAQATWAAADRLGDQQSDIGILTLADLKRELRNIKRRPVGDW